MSFRIMPNWCPGAFSVRCDLSPRHVHTLNEVAVELAPRGIAAVYAVRFAGEIPDRVVDITRRARFFYNARERYVEAFGQVGELKGEGWKVLAFFRAVTNHVDFSDREQMRRYLHMLSGLCAEGLKPDGLMWDEPGYTCTYGTLPYAPGIRREFSRKTGNEIGENLWKLALPAKDGSHDGRPDRLLRGDPAHAECIEPLRRTACEKALGPGTRIRGARYLAFRVGGYVRHEPRQSGPLEGGAGEDWRFRGPGGDRPAARSTSALVCEPRGDES